MRNRIVRVMNGLRGYRTIGLISISEVAVGVENTNAKSVYLGDRCLTQERDLLLLGSHGATGTPSQVGGSSTWLTVVSEPNSNKVGWTSPNPT
jgi:hypothetical protein